MNWYGEQKVPYFLAWMISYEGLEKYFGLGFVLPLSEFKNSGVQDIQNQAQNEFGYDFS